MHADIITISIGLNEVLYKLQNEKLNSYEMYSYIDTIINDIDELIDIIKRYCKEDIFILGYYNPFDSIEIDNYIKYANNKLIDISKQKDIIFVDLYNIFKNKKNIFTNPQNYYPNIDGYKLISQEIINQIKKNVLKK